MPTTKTTITTLAMRPSVRPITASTTSGTTRATSTSPSTTPMTMLTSTIAWCTLCVERARRAHSSTLDVVSHLIGSSPESFHNHLHTIHGAPSLIRFSLSTSTFSSLSFPSTPSTPSGTLSSTTRSSWKACATPPTRRVRTPTTSPLPSQFLLRWRQWCCLPDSVFGRSQGSCTRQSATFVPISTCTRWNCFRFGVRGCAMNLVPSCISLVEETTNMWVTTQHPLCSLVWKARCQVVASSRLGQTSCRCHDVPQLIHSVSRRSWGVRTVRSTRSIEIPVSRHKLCDDTVGSVRCRHEGCRPSVRREPDWVKLGELRRAKSWSWRNRTWRLSWSCAGQQITLSREEVRRFHGRQDRSCETQLLKFVSWVQSSCCLLSAWVFCLNMYTRDRPKSWELTRTPWMAQEKVISRVAIDPQFGWSCHPHNNYRTMFESRLSAGATEKLPCSENLSISSWSYDMEDHAKKCVERYCELANKTDQQLYKVSTPCIDDHHFKEEGLKSVGELSQVCSQIVMKCL